MRPIWCARRSSNPALSRERRRRAQPRQATAYQVNLSMPGVVLRSDGLGWPMFDANAALYRTNQRRRSPTNGFTTESWAGPSFGKTIRRVCRPQRGRWALTSAYVRSWGVLPSAFPWIPVSEGMQNTTFMQILLWAGPHYRIETYVCLGSPAGPQSCCNESQTCSDLGMEQVCAHRVCESAGADTNRHTHAHNKVLYAERCVL